MSKLLLVLHGMGRHTPTWADETIKQLVGLSADYGYRWFDQHGALDAHVTIVPVRYDEVFERRVTEWGKSSQALGAKAKEFGVSIPNILDWLERADGTENNFFWTHVVDVVLYRYFSIVTAEVRTRVRHDVAAALTTAMGGGNVAEASVLAHSLGTSVAHDALALLGSEPIGTRHGPNRAFMAGNFMFANVFMCANVSRVLETNPKVFESVVHPVTGGAGEPYVNAYYNFRHEFDPFPMVKPFAPVGWGENYVLEEKCEKILQFNVHGINHYLDDPLVHVPLLRALIGDDAVVTEPERVAATARYDAKAEPKCIAEVQKFKLTAGKAIALAKVGADPEALVIAGTQFLAAAREAFDACRQA